MNATLEIYSTRLDHVIYIPLEALFRQNDRPVAYLQQGTRFQMVPLDVATQNKDKVVVRKGLRPGDRIALVPPPAALILNRAPAPTEHPMQAADNAGARRLARLPLR